MSAVEVSQGWETVIGLEVHVQISTASKMYCACAAVNTQELSQANQHVCPVCLGHPGTLPRPNRQAVIRALALALHTGAQWRPRSVFARKNYFYPDLPKGYQITQYDLPLASGGEIPYWHAGEERRARLVRAHLEEDTAKLFHIPGSGDGPSPEGQQPAAAATAFLDFNRAGVPLLEIVTEPDFRGGGECVSYLEELRSLLRRLGISDAAMEAGNFRCEPNVSVRPASTSELRTKTELKNLNSFSTLRRAVEAEVARQIGLYESGGAVVQSTMRYDAELGATIPMRRKETADDYRYFDDPDIPPMVVSTGMVDEARGLLAESSFSERGRLVEQDGLGHEQAATIAGDDVLERFYSLCVADGHAPREVAKWVVGDLLRLMRERAMTIGPSDLSAILKALSSGDINNVQAKLILNEVYSHGKVPDETIESIKRNQESLFATRIYNLTAISQAVIDENPRIVADIQKGKLNAIQVLVGQVIKRTEGNANPSQARQLLAELLGVDLPG